VSLATDIIAVSLSGGALIVAGAGLRHARNANAASERANELSEKALAWQRERDTARLTPDVRISFEHSTEQRGPFFAWSDTPSVPQPLEYCLRIIVTNHGETTEYVTFLAVHEPKEVIEEGDSHEAIDISSHLIGAHGAHQELKPRARLSVQFSLGELTWDAAAQGGIVGEAWLASGGRIESDVEPIDAMMVEEVRTQGKGPFPP
jgi:hypothetical protein